MGCEKGDHIGKVQEYLRSIRAEPALVAAVPGALGCKPDKRAAFDRTTIISINSVIESALARLHAGIAASATMLKETSAEALGAWAILEVAKERTSDARVELVRAQELHSESTHAHQSAVGDVSNSVKLQNDLRLQEKLAGESVSSLSKAIDALSRLVASANAPEKLPFLGADSRALEANAEIKEGAVPAIVAEVVPLKAVDDLPPMKMALDAAPMGA